MITFLKNNKWILLIGIVFVLLLIPFLLAMIKENISQNNSSPSTKSGFGGVGGFFFRSYPTPTPFASTPLTIYSTSPADQDENVPTATPISITFSRGVTPSEQEAIVVHISPTASGSATWSDDKTTLTFHPTVPLLDITTYTINVVYGTSSTSWAFTTTAVPTPDAKEQEGRNQQTQLDQDWANYQNTIAQNYPWYNQLPLSGNTYFVTFDTHSQQFTADLYPDASIITQDTNRMKGEIQTQLENLGVDLTKYKIIWNVVPISPTPTPGS